MASNIMSMELTSDDIQRHTGFYKVGWIDSGVLFPTGNCSDLFVSNLLKLCTSFKMEREIGLPLCDLCCAEGKKNEALISLINESNEKVFFGCAVILVLGRRGKVYIAPDLIYHFVTQHSYLPPQEFIDSVCELEIDKYKVGKSLLTIDEFFKSYRFSPVLNFIRMRNLAHLKIYSWLMRFCRPKR
ncbi:MAG: hypothetical protein MI864_11040 [Pseudomonadales bacterium]|nr:hypothetical protein [Pseudomonadales bacterium]